MTRDEIPEMAADEPDDATLAAARAAYRALRDPLEPSPAQDARIRAAARKALASGPGALAAHPASPTPASSRSSPGASAGRVDRAGGKDPLASAGRAGRATIRGDGPASSPARPLVWARRHAGWGLALAAGLTVWVALLLPVPPAPFGAVPVPGEGAGDAGAEMAEGTEAPARQETALRERLPLDQAQAGAGAASAPAGGAGDAAAAMRAGGGAAEVAAMAETKGANVRLPVAASPAVRGEHGAAQPGASAGTTPEGASVADRAGPPALERRDAQVGNGVSSAGSSSPDGTADAGVAGPPPAAPVGVGAAAAPAAAAMDIERELGTLRTMLRRADPALAARLRAFVARYPEHPLARTDPALAAALARQPRPEAP